MLSLGAGMRSVAAIDCSDGNINNLDIGQLEICKNESQKELDMSLAATAPLETEVKKLGARIATLQKGINTALAKLKTTETGIKERSEKVSTQYLVLSVKIREMYIRLRSQPLWVSLLSNTGMGQARLELSLRQESSDRDKQIIVNLVQEIGSLEADKKKLLYLGKYSVHVCPRCETAVAFNEIEYAKQKDMSVYVKFPLKNEKNKHLLIFTTTPWTLPANTGVMVHPDAKYNEIELSNGEKWIIAKDLVSGIMDKTETGFTIKREFPGKDMKDWKYENPLSEHLNLEVKNGYRVVLSSRYVTTEDGTGLVHCAPGHGKEDYEVGKENGLDILSPVKSNGELMVETGKYAGKKAREVDKEIIEDLEKSGHLVYKELYEHDYPLCWRDKTPLLMIAQPQWFLKISGIQKNLLKSNDKTNWTPSWMKLRMKAWLEGIGDWPISRQRYWGTPLPIWTSDSGDKIVVGSMEELVKLSGKKKIDMHKPGIDKIVIKKNGKVYKRVSEVLDVWFDSGVSSWAALGFPKNNEKFKKYWPADLNIEGKDQVRGWWNSQSILSEITFGEKPFDSILEHGMILDISKRKMSKSLGNATSPEQVIEKYNRDFLRYYFAKLSKGDDFSYEESEFKEIQKTMMIFSNINTFINQLDKNKEKLKVEDSWILSKYNSFLKESQNLYNSYKFPELIQGFEKFVINDLSRTYIQMIRDRSDETWNVLNNIRLGIIKIIAPVMPFMTESVWQNLKEKGIVKDESVHLSKIDKVDEKKINKELEKDFDVALKLIEIGLKERDNAKIGLRWPLGNAKVLSNQQLNKEIQDIIAKQLNIKNIEVKTSNNSELKIELDTTMNDELEGEGYAREVARKIQAERKNLGMKKGDLIDLKIGVSEKLRKLLGNHSEFLRERTNSKTLVFTEDKLEDKGIVFTVKDEKILVIFRN